MFKTKIRKRKENKRFKQENGQLPSANVFNITPSQIKSNLLYHPLVHTAAMIKQVDDRFTSRAMNKDFSTAILEKKKSLNRLVVDEAINDDNSIVALNAKSWKS